MNAPNTVLPSDVPGLLDQFRREKFYGSLELRLEAGDVVLLKKTETIKPARVTSAALSRQSRESNGFRER
jgi:hypothetical protein